MQEIIFVDYLYKKDKIVCCQYLIDLIQPILLKKKITKKDYNFIFSVLNFCNLVTRNRIDNMSKEIKKRTILFYTILFNKTLEL